jgi:sensor histidine kinase YesM
VLLILLAGTYIYLFVAKYSFPILISIGLGAFVLLYNSFELTYFKLREEVLADREIILVESSILVLDVAIVTALIHFLGGQVSPLFSIYIITIFYAGLAMPYFKAVPYVLAFVEGTLYAGLVWLEYLKIIPHHSFYGEPQGILFESARMMALPVVMIVIAILFSCAYFSYYISRQLWAREEQLLASLAKAKELQGVSEGKVRETEEARNMLEQKMRELERTNRLMVGRELEMVSLKEEIAKLKGGLG